MGIEDELKEMSNALEEPSIDKEELKTDPPSTESSSTESPNTESPNTEPSSTEAPSTEAPEDPLAMLTSEIAELKQKLAEKDSTDTPGTNAPSTDAPISDEDFLSGIDLDDLSRDSEALSKILNTVYKKAIDTVRKEIRAGDEYIIRSMPDIVKNNIAIAAELKKVNEDFYTENKDLVPFKKVVGAVFEDILSENPDKTYNELLPKVAEETRKRLDLHKKAVSDDDPPPLPKSKNRRRINQSPPNTDPLLKELDEMDKALGLD